MFMASPGCEYAPGVWLGTTTRHHQERPPPWPRANTPYGQAGSNHPGPIDRSDHTHMARSDHSMPTRVKVTEGIQVFSWTLPYSAPSLESPLSARATISLFQSVNNPNFNTVFAYWYSTTGGICNAPMCIDHLNKP